MQQFCADTGCTLKSCRKQWTIEKRGEKGSVIFLLMAQQDDDDDIYCANASLNLINFKIYSIFNLVSLFNGISAFEGYLMPNKSL